MTALSGTTIDRNTTSSSRKRQAEHDADEERQPGLELGGDVVEGGGDAAHVHLDVGAGGRLGHDVVAQVIDEVRPWLRPARTRSGITWITAASPAWLGRGGLTKATPGAWRQRVVEASDVGLRAGPLLVGHDEQRAVEPRTEALGHEVVGAAGGLGRRRGCPSSDEPRRIENNGAASRTRTTRPPANGHGWRCRKRLQR